MVNKLYSLLLLFFLFSNFAMAKAIPEPSIRAKSFVLMDSKGLVLFSKSADERINPSNLAKVMTSYIIASALEKKIIHLNQDILISKNAWQTPGSRTFLDVGSKVEMEDLVRGMVVQSGNDATIAIVEAVAKSEDKFVRIMNSTAEKFGLINTHFSNTTGLGNPSQYSSAKDLAIISKNLIRDFPIFYKYFGETEFTYNDIRQKNRNLLLFRDPRIDGIHTGSSENDGYSMIASTQRDGLRLIAVVIGANNERMRAAETLRLLNYGYRYYTSKIIYKPTETIYEAKVWMGEKDNIRIGSLSGINATVSKKQDNVRIVINVNQNIKAPVRVGDIVGTIEIYDKDKLISTESLVSLDEVSKASMLKIFFHQILLLLGTD